jgi:hypothetical protein
MIEKSFGKNRYFERIVITQTKPVCGMSGIAKSGSLASLHVRTLPPSHPHDPGHGKDDQNIRRMQDHGALLSFSSAPSVYSGVICGFPRIVRV